MQPIPFGWVFLQFFLSLSGEFYVFKSQYLLTFLEDHCHKEGELFCVVDSLKGLLFWIVFISLWLRLGCLAQCYKWDYLRTQIIFMWSCLFARLFQSSVFESFFFRFAQWRTCSSMCEELLSLSSFHEQGLRVVVCMSFMPIVQRVWMERKNTILSGVEQSVGEVWSLLGCIDIRMLRKLFVCKDFCNYPSLSHFV